MQNPLEHSLDHACMERVLIDKKITLPIAKLNSVAYIYAKSAWISSEDPESSQLHAAARQLVATKYTYIKSTNLKKSLKL